jgi:serine/threonine protein kinase
MAVLLGEIEMADAAHQLVLALDCLHRNQIMHCDIKLMVSLLYLPIKQS